MHIPNGNEPVIAGCEGVVVEVYRTRCVVARVLLVQLCLVPRKNHDRLARFELLRSFLLFLQEGIMLRLLCSFFLDLLLC